MNIGFKIMLTALVIIAIMGFIDRTFWPFEDSPTPIVLIGGISAIVGVIALLFGIWMT